MFAKNKKTNIMAKTNEQISKEVNRIVEGTVIEGQIKANGDIRIDGTITGSIDAKGKVIVGPNGTVDGDIVCQSADVYGKLKVKITVAELLYLKSTAKLSGDIITDKLAIDPGAVFAGTCSMGGAIIKNMKQNDYQSNGKRKPTQQTEKQIHEKTA